MHILLKNLLKEGISDRVLNNPNFKKWFKDSKAVDNGGKPLILIHATHSNFNSFKYGDIGFHFGSIDAAKDRGVWQSAVGGYKTDGESHMPVFLSIQNPIRLQDAMNWHKPQSVGVVIHHAVDSGAIDKNDLHKAMESVKSYTREDPYLPSKFWRDVLIKLGYDGVVYKNKVEGKDDSWIAFEPTQIKSIYNNGEFDPHSPYISK